ncbi:MAG: hypothetical protein R2743_06190 [Ilumatobacteraceae bacterium]
MNGQAMLALQLLDSQLDALEGRRRRLPERAAVEAAAAAHATHAAERTRLEAVIAEAGAPSSRPNGPGSSSTPNGRGWKRS